MTLHFIVFIINFLYIILYKLAIMSEVFIFLIRGEKMRFNNKKVFVFICSTLMFSSTAFAMEMTTETVETEVVAQNMITTDEQNTTVEIVQNVVETQDEVATSSTSSALSEIDKLAADIKQLKLEISKMELLEQKSRLEASLEKEALVLENELYDAKQDKLLSEIKAKIAQIKAENALRIVERQRMHGYLSDESKKVQLHNALLEARNHQRSLELKQEMLETKLKTDKLSYQLQARKKQEEWNKQVNKEQVYTKDPFSNDTLTITDRRIVLEGAIWYGTSDYIVERIQYFNNQSTEHPIFLVITYSPGGSVMEGIRILNAMQKSRAPVYVVVKSFAASMAAVLATLAEKSFAYPDAIIIHHQVWGLSFGNKREQKEQLKILDEWSQRITQGVAEKMGLTLEEFVDKMYEHNSIGDWIEFADNAVKIKWVDHVITDIRDTSYYKKPKEPEEEDEDADNRVRAEEQIDTDGNLYVKVPRLKPLDVYHMYNPDNYYRP